MSELGYESMVDKILILSAGSISFGAAVWGFYEVTRQIGLLARAGYIEPARVIEVVGLGVTSAVALLGGLYVDTHRLEPQQKG